MTKLNLTREQVEKTYTNASNHLMNLPEDVGAQEMFCYSQDWLAMYNLLKEIYDMATIEDTLESMILKCHFPIDRIRELLGGE